MKSIWFIILIFTISTLPAQQDNTVLFGQGNYLKQLEWLDKQPESAVKHHKIGRIYYQTGNYKKAIYHLQISLQLQNDNKVKSLLAQSYDKYGLTDKAIQEYEQLIKKDTTNYLAMYALTKLYANKNSFKKAILWLKKLSKKDSLNPNYPYKMGIYSKVFDHKLNYFNKAYRLDTTHLKSIYLMIKLYKKIQYNDSANYFINKGLTIAPNDFKLLRQKVIVSYKAKSYDTMIRYLKRLDALHYDSIFVYKNLGLAYLMQKKLQKAEQYFHKVVASGYNEPVIYYYLGLLFKEKENYKKALAYFKTSIKLKKPDISKEYLEMGRIANKQKKYNTAVKYFNLSFQNKITPEPLFQLGFTYDFLLDKPNKALKYYQNYLKLFKNKNMQVTEFVDSRIKVLKEKIFMNK